MIIKALLFVCVYYLCFDIKRDKFFDSLITYLGMYCGMYVQKNFCLRTTEQIALLLS